MEPITLVYPVLSRSLRINSYRTYSLGIAAVTFKWLVSYIASMEASATAVEEISARDLKSGCCPNLRT